MTERKRSLADRYLRASALVGLGLVSVLVAIVLAAGVIRMMS